MDVSPKHPTKPYRSLKLGDLVGLVAACALGWGGAGFVRQTRESWSISNGVWTKDLREWFVLGLVQFLILAWFVVLRSFHWSRSERLQPGYVACLALLVSSAVQIAMLWADRWNEPASIRQVSLARQLLYFYLVPSPFGQTATVAAILSAWLTLLIAVGWQRSLGALEHVGRAVACGFLAAFIVIHFFPAWLDR